MKNIAIILMLMAGAAHAQDAAPSADPVDDQIVVIGEKLKTWKGGVTKENGRLMCRTKESTGDKQLDAIRCGGMLTCIKPLEPRIDKLMSSDVSRLEKRDKFNAMLAGTKPCLDEYEDAAIARLAAERPKS